MRRTIAVLITILAAAPAATAQSLYLAPGERAVEVSAGWSVGPNVDGLETHAGISLDGRWDVGLAFHVYEDFEEYAPFARFFAVKQAEGGAPVSLAVSAQIFLDDFPSDEDSGRFVQIGTTVYKSLKLSDRFAMQPFVGFAFVAESYAFGGEDAETARYLTRDIGLHFTTATDRPWIWRATLLEQSFRRETYRAARIAAIRRF
jgi:hypothetical protein